MTDMVERVARAIYDTQFDEPTWNKVAEQSIVKAAFQDAARAAIAAMREPTEAMAVAGGVDGPAMCWDDERPENVWRAMIDVALAEK